MPLGGLNSTVNASVGKSAATCATAYRGKSTDFKTPVRGTEAEKVDPGKVGNVWGNVKCGNIERKDYVKGNEILVYHQFDKKMEMCRGFNVLGYGNFEKRSGTCVRTKLE